MWKECGRHTNVRIGAFPLTKLRRGDGVHAERYVPRRAAHSSSERMSVNTFDCICLERIGKGAVPAIATAAARAGGIGIVDLEFVVRDEDRRGCIDALLRAVVRGAIGVRLTAMQIASSGATLDGLRGRAHWLIVAADGGPKALRDAIDALPISASRRLLVEVTDVDQVRSFKERTVDAVIGKGSEAGGRVGDDTSFVLLQKLVSLGWLPVFVRGGIGVHGAAACRAAGAAGVVLDDQLLLLAETSLPRQWFRHFEQLSGKETVTVDDAGGDTWRVLSRPGRRHRSPVANAAPTPSRFSEAGVLDDARRPGGVGIDWDDKNVQAWPVGQAVGFAASLRDRYRSTGRVVRAYRDETAVLLERARAVRPLAPDSALAKSHGTRYPIVQGPMTRVSDTAEFGAAVAEAGALPFLALALMRGEQVRRPHAANRDSCSAAGHGVSACSASYRRRCATNRSRSYAGSNLRSR